MASTQMVSRLKDLLLRTVGSCSVNNETLQRTSITACNNSRNNSVPVETSSEFDFSHFITSSRGDSEILRTAAIIIAYSAIIVVSLFGNALVCSVVLWQRPFHPSSATNAFLVNLAASDLLLTLLNVPLSVARILLDDWPFGEVLCRLVPLAQVVSAYVSTFTMACIAIDRYRLVTSATPSSPNRLELATLTTVVIVWAASTALSLPYALYSEIEPIFTYRLLIRCQARYPSPALQFRRWLTLATFLTQYVIPLSVTAVAYGALIRRIRNRKLVGSATDRQAERHARVKMRTIRMLTVAVLVFAACWLPLNLYHMVTDFMSEESVHRHSSTAFFVCHWLAMSSVCYNPFIYCGLNQRFRAAAKHTFTCCFSNPCCVAVGRRSPKIHPTVPQDRRSRSTPTSRENKGLAETYS